MDGGHSLVVPALKCPRLPLPKDGVVARTSLETACFKSLLHSFHTQKNLEKKRKLKWRFSVAATKGACLQNLQNHPSFAKFCSVCEFACWRPTTNFSSQQIHTLGILGS